MQTVTDYFRVLRGTSAYYAERSTEQIQRNALVGGSVLIGICTLIIFGSMLLGLYVFNQSDGAMNAVQEEFQLDPAEVPYEFQPGVPYFTLLFAVYWFGIIAILGVLRYLLLRILGEVEPTFFGALSITTHAVIPMVIVATLISILNNIAPVYLSPEGSAAFTFTMVRVAAVTLLAFGGIFLEMLYAAGGLRQMFAQPTGRAWLTAVLPWLLGCVTSGCAVLLE